MDKDNITIFPFQSKWHVIDETIIDGTRYYLLEDNTYGKDTPMLVIDKNYILMASDIKDGLDEFRRIFENGQMFDDD